MLYSIIIICHVFSHNKGCLMLSDTEGPYKTILECKSRNKQMIIDAKNVLDDYELQSSKCVTSEEKTKLNEKNALLV